MTGWEKECWKPRDIPQPEVHRRETNNISKPSETAKNVN